MITTVTEPTKWTSNMVVVRKPNKIRICLDPMHLNKAIKRNHYPMPTMEDITPRLKKAKVFTTDATNGFFQELLEEPSSYRTTFWMPAYKTQKRKDHASTRTKEKADHHLCQRRTYSSKAKGTPCQTEQPVNCR